MKLNTGETLPAGVKFVGWVNQAGQEVGGAEVCGYHPDDYFRNGKYLGPDEFGIEPVWSDAN